MRIVSTLCALLFASTALAQHDHSDHTTPPDTSNIPAKLKDAFASTDPVVLEARKNVVRELYFGLIHPAPIPVLTGIKSVENIFQKGVVQGRVAPLGAYTDFNSAYEYFYALGETALTHIAKIDFRSLIAGDDKVGVEVDLHVCRYPFQLCDLKTGENMFILKETGFFTFNEENRIISFDLVIPNLNAAMDQKPETHDAAIVQMCVGLTQLHQDPLTGKPVGGGTCTKYFDSPDDFPLDSRDQYGSSPFQNCVKFMHSIPFGSWSRANSNTVVCRQLHTLLTPHRPDDHCPHVSSSGGGKCVDQPYSVYFDKDY